MVVLALLLALSCLCGAEEACSREEQGCRASGGLGVAAILAQVEELTRPEDQIKRLKEAIEAHPDSPDLLLGLTQRYMAMFDRLHPKMRGIGELELVQPAIEIYMRLLRLPADAMTDEKHAYIVDHCVTSLLGSTNKTASVMVIKEALERMNPAIPMETYQFYFESLVEELFFGREYTEAVELVDKVRTMFPGKHKGIKLIAAIIQRFNERTNNQPHVVSHDLIKKIMPKTDEDKREVIMYTRELESQLRSFKRDNETDVMFEVCSEMGLYPSKYQRANMQVGGLTGAPVWEVGKSGQEEQLKAMEEEWSTIRGELKNLTQELEDWEWTENRVLESKGLWGQFFYLGNGRTELEADGPHCQLTPTFCRILSTFTSTLSCALCEVKLEYVEVAAHVSPHCGETNAKLRASIPVTAVHLAHRSSQGEPSFNLRVADQVLEWTEGKFTVWDDSFENELKNDSGTAQDFKHPEVTPEDDFLDPSLWEVEIGETGAVRYQLRPDLMS